MAKSKQLFLVAVFHCNWDGFFHEVMQNKIVIYSQNTRWNHLIDMAGTKLRRKVGLQEQGWLPCQKEYGTNKQTYINTYINKWVNSNPLQQYCYCFSELF